MRPLVLVSIDSWRLDHLTSDVTPNIWALDGLRYTQMVAGGSWTVPSHTCLFTGQGPWRHEWTGTPPNRVRAPLNHPTLFSRLQRRGYATHFWGANILTACRQDGEYWSGPGEQGKTADGQADEIVAWMRRQGSPYALLLHYWGAHAPYGLGDDPTMVGPLLKIDRAKVQNAYRQRLQAIDTELGPILDQALADDALICVVADHGEDFGIDHILGDKFHYGVMHCVAWRDEAILTPCVIGNAGISGTVAYQTRNYDITPTLWHFLFGEPFEGADGRPALLNDQDNRIAECWSTEWDLKAKTIRLGDRRCTRLMNPDGMAHYLGGTWQDWDEMYELAVCERLRSADGDESTIEDEGLAMEAVMERLRSWGYE